MKAFENVSFCHISEDWLWRSIFNHNGNGKIWSKPRKGQINDTVYLRKINTSYLFVICGNRYYFKKCYKQRLSEVHILISGYVLKLNRLQLIFFLNLKHKINLKLNGRVASFICHGFLTRKKKAGCGWALLLFFLS